MLKYDTLYHICEPSGGKERKELANDGKGIANLSLSILEPLHEIPKLKLSIPFLPVVIFVA